MYKGFASLKKKLGTFVKGWSFCGSHAGKKGEELICGRIGSRNIVHPRDGKDGKVIISPVDWAHQLTTIKIHAAGGGTRRNYILKV